MAVSLLTSLGIVAATFYCGGKPALDFAIGKDSVWSRYLFRPIYNGVSHGSVKTEEAWQQQLQQNGLMCRKDWVQKLIRYTP